MIERKKERRKGSLLINVTILNVYRKYNFSNIIHARHLEIIYSSRDETLEALGDANTVAPATRTADLHSQSRRNSYLYVFDYQSKFGDYPQVRSQLKFFILE